MTRPLFKTAIGAFAAAAALAAALPAHAGKTLDTIKQRGQLVCGVNPSLPGFSAADSQGNWTGLDKTRPQEGSHGHDCLHHRQA